MKMIDIPPMWLAVFAALAWMQPRVATAGLSFGGDWARAAGGVLVAAGLGLLILAVLEFRRARTTVIPHQEPAALVTSGVFAISRNPIYLGDALILLGLILRWDAVLSLILVPLFVWWIGHRFIRDEEARLDRAFGAAFGEYMARVRRWI